MRDNSHPEYDPQERARASTRAMLRCLVCGYLLYIAWQLVKGVRAGNTSMSPALAYTGAAVFALAAVGFGVYLLLQWRREAEKARLSGEEPEGEDE